ncbi:Uncharacterised protein [uncultured archaeon]|nr:Uncharacterised protein [uncultured archaeon]
MTAIVFVATVIGALLVATGVAPLKSDDALARETVDAYYAARLRQNYSGIAAIYDNGSLARSEGMYAPVDAALGRLKSYNVTNVTIEKWMQGETRMETATILITAEYENGDTYELLNLIKVNGTYKVDGWLVDTPNLGGLFGER